MLAINIRPDDTNVPQFPLFHQVKQCSKFFNVIHPILPYVDNTTRYCQKE